MIEMELRDELEVPGHVVMFKTHSNVARQRAMTKVREILDQYEASGITQLRDLPRSAKDMLIQQFDIIGLAHDDLE